jgi:isoquinoline 1-oxidoreductase subunit beta
VAGDTIGATRREFITYAVAATSGLLLGGTFTLRGRAAADVILNAWVRITADNVVTLVTSQAEMGQGAGTTLPAILAEELGADWDAVRIEQAPVDAAYRNPRVNWQFTGNSESTTGFFDLLRQIGAGGRHMLVQAAADRWRVAPEACVTERSRVLHLPSGRSVSFGDVADAASRITPPAHPRLKARAEWTLLGRSLLRVESRAKLDGSAVFGLDVRLPGMVYAAILLPPAAGGRLAHIDRTPAVSMPGVIDVVEVAGGVAVVADSYWRARTALRAMPVAFDPGPNRMVDSVALDERYRAALDGDRWTRVKLAGSPPPAGEEITADYRSQWLAHATMEPMNCTAHATDARCDIWGPIQGQELVRAEVARALSLPLDQVFVNRTLLGGGFGRRLYGDYAEQAALISRAVGRPVQLIWSRETDMQHDGYRRPAVANRLTATLDAAGRPVSIVQRVVSPTILAPVYPPVLKAPYDPSCLEGTLEWRYKIPHWQVDFHQLEVPIKTSVLRTTGYGPNLFALESFIDELAVRAHQDPWRFRRDLLGDDTRALAVLDTAARGSGWDDPPVAGRFRGIAFAEAFRTLIAHVVELSVRGEEVTVHRVTCAFDAGVALDPDICRNSMEGGVAWGLTCAFKSAITFAGGAVQQSNFHDYPLLEMAEMPPVDVHIVNSDALLLGGTGEVGPVTLIPALTNALAAATGQRIRTLPLGTLGFRLSRTSRR